MSADVGRARMRWGEVIKAGTVFEYTRPSTPPETIVFMLLEDRCITPEDVIADQPGALCLVLMGCVYDSYPGMTLRLKGIIDASKEIGT